MISLVEHGEEEGTIETDERELIERMFVLNDLTANDVMTPVRRLLMLDGRHSIRDNLTTVLDGTYSRIPLYGENPNEVLGRRSRSSLPPSLSGSARFVTKRTYNDHETDI